MAMTPPPDYLRAECRAAARRLARLVRDGAARDPEAPAHARVPAEGAINAHLLRVVAAERDSGSRFHVLPGAMLRHVFWRWARYLETIDRVTVEPGRVALRRRGDLDEWRDVPGEKP
jgi:hypothetical protein